MKPNSACSFLVLQMAFVLIAGALATVPLGAQDSAAVRARLHVVDSTRIQVITMRDGSSLVGRIAEVRPDTIEFQMGIGRVPVAVRDIREITESGAGRVHDGQYWFP